MTTRLAFLAVATTSAVLYACSTGNTGVGGTGDGGSHSGGDSGVILASGDGGATFAANQGNPFGIALDSTNVYWSDVGKFTNAPLSEPNYTIGSGTLMKAPLAGGAPTTLLSGLNWPSSIAVDSTNIYWLTSSTTAAAGTDGAVMQMPLAGGTPITLAVGYSTLASELTSANSIAVDSANVYFVHSGTEASCGTCNSFENGALLSVPIGGGTVTTLASGQYAPVGVVVDSTNVYWTNSNNLGSMGSVMQVPKSGGTPVILASGQEGPWAIAVDATSVYWTSYESVGSALYKVPIGGGTIVPLMPLSLTQALFAGVAIDGTNAYVTNMGTPCFFSDNAACGDVSGALLEVPLAGGPITILGTSMPSPSSIAVNATNIFWTNPAAVFTMPK